MWPTVLEFLKATFPEWASAAAPFLVALIGCYVVFLLLRMRYQGKIEHLEERIRLRDDLIKLKDEAIGSASASAPRAVASLPEQTAIQQSAPLPTLAPRPATANPRFTSINAQLISDMEATIINKLITTRYKFVFNPMTGANKVLTFKRDGDVGEGKNDNEFRWRVTGGRLEILNGRGGVYSRFFVLPDDKLHHTNDPDTRSIKGQYLQPLS